MAGLLGDLVQLGGQGAKVTQEQLGTLAPVVKAFFQSFMKSGTPPVSRPAIEATQLRLPLESRQRGRFVSPTRVTNPEDVTRSLQPRMVDLPNAPSRMPAGQINIPGTTIPGATVTRRTSALAPGGPQAPVPAWVPQSQEAQQLLSTDPGTYRSILAISNKASDAYGIPAAEVFDNLVGPKGIDYLRALEYGEPGGLMRQGSAGMVKGGSGGGATGGLARMSDQGPGAITRSPGGQVTEPMIERVRVEDITRGGAMTPVQTEALPSLASRPLMGGDAVTAMGARNAVGGTRQADLSNLYKAAAGLAGVGGLGIALDQYERGQSEKRADQIKQQLTDFVTEALSPESPMGPTTADPEVGAKIPAVTGGNPAAQIPAPLGTPNLPNTANPPAPESFEPAMRGMPQPGMMGAGQVVIRTNDGESNYRQAAANAQAQGAGRLGSGARGMYAVERAAATKAGQSAATIEALKGMGAPGSVGIETDIAFEQWAKANPVLAYRLMEQRRTMPSQQMPVAKQTEITSEAGTNVNKLVEGSMKMGMEDPAGQFQGSADLRQFMAPRSATYIGQPPINMYR